MIEFLKFIRGTGYEVIFIGLTSTFMAQVLKFVIFTLRSRKINFKIFSTTGGMPSSHSAGVVGLSTAVGLLTGFDSLIFAVALSYALVTMYDAAGIRRNAGKTAACLNRMMEDFYNHDTSVMGERLKELLGHTPIEVIAGATFGIIYAIYAHSYIVSL
ncbi:divergent PAP2 family protein [bacterium]|nr:divergent PAP2 family protein [bacterium]